MIARVTVERKVEEEQLDAESLPWKLKVKIIDDLAEIRRSNVDTS